MTGKRSQIPPTRVGVLVALTPADLAKGQLQVAIVCGTPRFERFAVMQTTAARCARALGIMRLQCVAALPRARVTLAAPLLPRALLSDPAHTTSMHSSFDYTSQHWALHATRRVKGGYVRAG